MSEKKKIERKKVEDVKKLTEQELQVQTRELHQKKMAKAEAQIRKILIENNLMMEVEHVIKLVPTRR